MDNFTESVIQAFKFVLYVLKAQFGKTFAVIQRIMTELKQDDEGAGRSLHLIHTMNTLLNNAQFTNRLKEIVEKYGPESIAVLSSKPPQGPYNHVKNLRELLGLVLIEQTCPRVVIVCSNKKRYEDLSKLIMHLNDFNGQTHVKRVFAYYDELHAYITPVLRQQIEEIHKCDIVHGIAAMTATPDKILKNSGFWSTIQQVALDNYNEEDYAGVKDMLFKLCDNYFPTPYRRPVDFDQKDKETIGFIKYVLRKYPNILGKSTRTFIPGHVRRESHKKIRKLVKKLCPNAIVVVLNGEEKSLTYYSNDTKETLNLTSKSEEVAETISRIILSNNLQERPLVITGMLCVGMGQTLMHKSLGSFTSAIFSHLDLTNDEIYQLFCRISGRIKTWGDKYVQTKVYCPTTIMNRCIVMEECAENIVKNCAGKVITQDDYRRPMYEMDSDIAESAIENIRGPKQKTGSKKCVDPEDKAWEPFNSQEEAREYIAKNFDVGTRQRAENQLPATLRNKQDGGLPTTSYILRRFYGLDENCRIRMVPSRDGKWHVYWKYSCPPPPKST